jgi:DNA adenine methylase
MQQLILKIEETSVYLPDNSIYNLNQVSPFLKWAGGKTQLLKSLSKYKPKNFKKYIEPFLGSGAFFFHLQPQTAILADSNDELINCFRVVQNNVHELIQHLKSYKNTKEFYYSMREQDPENFDCVERAARFIFLNRTCFNGLFRVNKRGMFNVPYGHYKNPTICEESKLLAAHEALKQASLICQDYKWVLREYAKPGDFIYLDPPYYPVSKYSDFKRYTKEFFYEEDHIELSNEFRKLVEMGCHALLTNSNCEFVRQLYDDFNYEIVDTQRLINKDASKRKNGEDVIVFATKPEKKSRRHIGIQKSSSAILKNFPGTRFMGSKYSILASIWDCVKTLDFETVFDAFSGSGCVAYMFKQYGKRVITNDFLNFCYHFSKAIIENNNSALTPSDVDLLLSTNTSSGRFISETFQGLYYNKDDLIFLDQVRDNIELLYSPTKKSLALAALTRACLKKRPRGIFTYIGNRYNDGRKDLQLSLKQHFIENIEAFNHAVFSNGFKNRAYNTDTLQLKVTADLVYIDPPYYTPHSDNEYTRRYHFVEGLCRRWKGLDIQWNTKTKKFKRYETPFGSIGRIYNAFDKLFDMHRDSILVVSYSSNSIPTKPELASMLKKFKKSVEVHQIQHKYTFGNQGFKVGNNANDVREYIFIAR